MSVQVSPAQNPYQQYCDFADSRTSTNENALLLVPFSFRQTWLSEEPVELVAVYFFSGTTIQYSVVKCESHALAIWDTSHDDLKAALQRWLKEHHSPLFCLHQPLPLETVAIPKPWGQEIWYTGVEERGVACFGSDNCKVPIPYLLAVMPLIGRCVENQQLILLKILDPLPEEVFGDLYFELHEEKQEVYVVTHVDKTAWPDGVGQMRLGFNPQAIEQAGSDAKFRQQFMQQVLSYRKVRKAIDDLLDKKREQNGWELNGEVPVALLKRWLQEIPKALTTQEKKIRQAMESFYGSMPLKIGDVVKVPLNVPHSLQHGVRTIEFQTPVYERQIVAFGQKVLTQSDWDTEKAVEVMEVTTPSPQQLPLLRKEEGLSVERVVDFSDFRVERIALSSPAFYNSLNAEYRLLIVLQGALIVNGLRVAKEEAVLLPASPSGFQVEPAEDQQVVFLVASPNS